MYIRSCGLPVAEDDVSALFGNIEDLLTLNSELLSELETCQNNPTRIAEAFVTRVSFGDKILLAVYVGGCLVFQASSFLFI